MGKHAPARDDGLKPYVKTTTSWGRDTHSIVWAGDLAAAKRAFGWTRQLHTTITVRRATVDDMDRSAQ